MISPKPPRGSETSLPLFGLQGKTWCTWSYFQRIARRLRSCRTRRGAQNRGGYMGVFSKSKLRCLIISTNSMCFQKVANFQTPPYQLEYLLAMWASAMQRLSPKGRLKEENQDVGREPPSRFRTWMTNETLQVNRSQWFAWIDDFSRKLDMWRTLKNLCASVERLWWSLELSNSVGCASQHILGHRKWMKHLHDIRMVTFFNMKK